MRPILFLLSGLQLFTPCVYTSLRCQQHILEDEFQTVSFHGNELVP